MKKYLCVECGNVLQTANGLKSHMKTHSDDRPFGIYKRISTIHLSENNMIFFLLQLVIVVRLNFGWKSIWKLMSLFTRVNDRLNVMCRAVPRISDIEIRWSNTRVLNEKKKWVYGNGSLTHQSSFFAIFFSLQSKIISVFHDSIAKFRIAWSHSTPNTNYKFTHESIRVNDVSLILKFSKVFHIYCRFYRNYCDNCSL